MLSQKSVALINAKNVIPRSPALRETDCRTTKESFEIASPRFRGARNDGQGSQLSSVARIIKTT